MMQNKHQVMSKTQAMAIVRATSYTRDIQAIKVTLRYIQHRIGKNGQKITRALFGRAGEMTEQGDMERLTAYEMIDDAGEEKGMVFFRFVISPDQRTEDTDKDLDLMAITDKTMRALQAQFGKDVPYAGAIHDDHTDIRHVHLIACVQGRLGVTHFQTMYKTATAEAESQRQQRDATRQPQQQQEGGQWAGLAAS
jgi:hypothetical protein